MVQVSFIPRPYHNVQTPFKFARTVSRSYPLAECHSVGKELWGCGVGLYWSLSLCVFSIGSFSYLPELLYHTKSYYFPLALPLGRGSFLLRRDSQRTAPLVKLTPCEAVRDREGSRPLPCGLPIAHT